MCLASELESRRHRDNNKLTIRKVYQSRESVMELRVGEQPENYELALCREMNIADDLNAKAGSNVPRQVQQLHRS